MRWGARFAAMSSWETCTHLAGSPGRVWEMDICHPSPLCNSGSNHPSLSCSLSSKPQASTLQRSHPPCPTHSLGSKSTEQRSTCIDFPTITCAAYITNSGSVRNILHVSYSAGGWMPTSPQDSIHAPWGSPRPLQCWQKTTGPALMNHIPLPGYKGLMNSVRDRCLGHLWIPKAWEMMGVPRKRTGMGTMIRHCARS